MITVYELLLLLELINAILVSIVVLTGRLRGETLKDTHRILEENNRIVKRINNTVNSSENQLDVQSKKSD